MFRFMLAVYLWLIPAVLYGDEFLDRVKQLEEINARATPTCPCRNCNCEPGIQCNSPYCPKCAALSKAKELPASIINYRHVCGCNGGYQCNCGSVCHCHENIAFNRQPVRWIFNYEFWGLYQGAELLGGLNSSGSYYPWVNGEWGPKSKPPTGAPPIPNRVSAGSSEAEPPPYMRLVAGSIPAPRSFCRT